MRSVRNPSIARLLQPTLGGAVETYDAGKTVPKTGGVVKRREFWLVIHVQPFAAALSSERRCAPDEFQADALATMCPIDRWIE